MYGRIHNLVAHIENSTYLIMTLEDKQVILSSGRKIGIIGGLAFRAGVYYYEHIFNRCAAEKSSLQLLLSHASVDLVIPLISSGNRVELGKYLGSLANELFDAGASTVSVTAIAPHIAIDEIRLSARGPIISALDSVGPAVKTQGIERIAVFGNKAVMATNIFGAVSDNLIVSLSESVQEQVHQMYMDIALNGKRGTKTESDYLNKLANDLIKREGVQAIVLAGTDLSSFYATEPPEYPFLDMAQLHIEQIISNR